MRHTSFQTAAIGAGTLIAGVAAFQVALALGVPLGEATFGGNATAEEGVLSPGFRAIALVSAAILVLFAWIILARAGVVTSRILSARLLFWATWAIVAFLALNTLGNVFASHPFERYVMSAVTFVLVVLCSIVALRAPLGDGDHWVAYRTGNDGRPPG